MKRFISINLNQSESRETLREQWRERGRWTIFGLIIFLMTILNVQTVWIGKGYTQLIERKKLEIAEVKNSIADLRKEGKNLSKEDIVSLAKLENDRILWAQNMKYIGEMTPDDMALTAVKFKGDKIVISGVAVVYQDRKDFDIVHDYINRLKGHKKLGMNFSNIKFNQGALKKIREQEIVEFEIEATVGNSKNTNGTEIS